VIFAGVVMKNSEITGTSEKNVTSIFRVEEQAKQETAMNLLPV
jgi:hypothetical protein